MLTCLQTISSPATAESAQDGDKECPLDKDELGRNTWSMLHTMAAYYEETPSKKQQHEMKQFIRLFANFYPCEPCAVDLRERYVHRWMSECKLTSSNFLNHVAIAASKQWYAFIMLFYKETSTVVGF